MYIGTKNLCMCEASNFSQSIRLNLEEFVSIIIVLELS